MTYAQSTLNVHVTGRRVVATLIDGIVLGLLGGIVAQLFGTRTAASGFDFTTLSTGGSLGLFFVVLVYYVLMESLLGRTVGKMVTGIRVVDEATGNRPGFGAAIGRTLLRLIDGLFGYLVGFIIVTSSVRRRRLGDMAAKTLVVRA
jgi:uncharacterized RDD family membrane protein YckC